MDRVALALIVGFAGVVAGWFAGRRLKQRRYGYLVALGTVLAVMVPAVAWARLSGDPDVSVYVISGFGGVFMGLRYGAGGPFAALEAPRPPDKEA